MRFVFLFFLLLASGSSLACLDTPLPTTPEQPISSAIYEQSGESTEVTAWRRTCTNGEEVLLLTFEPLQGNEFVCSVAFDVIQDQTQFENFRLLTDPDNLSSSFCDDLLVKSTFAVGQSSFDVQWDTSEPFRLAWNSDLFLEVGIGIFEDRFESLSAPDGFCLDFPLPTSPTGPTWTGTREDTFSGEVTEVTAWRYDCPEGDTILLLTFEPTQGAEFVCSVAFDVVQDSVQYNNFILHYNEEGQDSFCTNLLVKQTFVVGQSQFDPNWDNLSAFNLYWDSELIMGVGAY